MNPSILEIIYLAILLIACLLLIIFITLNAKQMGLIVCFIILVLNNNPVITSFFEDIGISGSPIFFIILVFISTFFLYPLNFSKISSHLIKKEGILLLLSLIFVGVSAIVSIDRTESIKAFLYFLIMLLYGWFIVGKVIINYNEPRKLMIKIVDVYGVLSIIFTLLTITFVGPMIFKGQFGGAESIINLFGISLHRLQGKGLNAPIVGVSSAIAIFWLYSAFSRNHRNFSRKLFIAILILISVLGLLWSGSRGAIIAFFATWIITSFLSQKDKKMNLKKYLGLLFVLGMSIYFFSFHFVGILYRGTGSQALNQSLLSLFLDSRINIHGEDISNILEPSFLGRGYGVLPTIDDGGLILESFFLKMYVELGIIGGLIYLFTFFALTLSVVKVDRFFAKLGERGAFFPSSIMIFTWMNSISSWGFSLPVGVLALQIAITSIAVYIWQNKQLYNTNSKTEVVL